MSTVALPTTSTGAAFRTEADLVRAAARSDRDSFEELYRRHSQPAWRLAQAVTSSPALAADSVAEGFSQVLRGLRRRRLSADSPFRPALLTQVYRVAMDRVRTAKASASPNVTAGDAGPVPQATAAAFRSLPERWRAAVWLTEVEQMERPAVAIILGVSVPVAGQLVERGREGLLSRFSQADVAVPDHLGSALRPLAAAVPASMEATTIKRWKGSLAVAPAGRLAPAQEWLAERAARPLGIACGGLVALGMVGLGVLTVASSPTSTGPAAAISAPPATAGPPVNPSPGGHGNLLFGPGAGASAFANSFGGGAGFGTDALTTSGGGSTNPILAGEGNAATQATATPTAAAPSAAPGVPGGGVSGNPGSTGTSGSGSIGTPPPPPVTQTPAPLVNVPGVIAVNQPPAGGVAVTVGSPSAPVVGATVTPTCTGLQILNIQLNTCQNPPPPAPAPAAPAPLLGGLTGLLGNLLK